MFIVCGEALMDVFIGDSNPTGVQLDARIGGSPLNVAIGLARLGQPVGFLGGVSQGPLGERLLKAMRDEGVQLDTVEHLPAPTTLSLIGVDAAGVPAYAFYGEGCADRLLPASALARIPSRANVFQFGSYAMVVGETAATQRALVEREQGRSLVSYDPNVRLNVQPDPQVWRDAIAWMLPRTQLLKVSDEDLALLYPGRSIDDIGAEWATRGPALVVVTRGGEGARAWHGGQVYDAAPQKIQVVDTVGAGDTFTAALLTRLTELGHGTPAGLAALQPAQVRDVLGFAIRAAAITCTRRGADLPRRRELGA